MPLGRNCVTALPVAVVHRSGRQCTGPAVAAILVISALTTHTSESAGQVGTSGTSAARVSVTTNARRTCQQADQRRRVQGKASGGSKGTGQIGVWSALAIARSSSPTWAGCTLSVVASGTTPAPVPVALAGALGAAAAVSVATGNEGAAAAVQVQNAHKDGAQEDKKGDACCLGESDHTSLA